jgi:hypothetical protein
MSDRPFEFANRPAALRLIVLIALCVMTSGLVPTLHAVTVRPPTFENLVTDADQILRVEVTSSSSRWDEAVTGGQKVLHTYVECRVLRTLKGPENPTVTLRFYGGRVGNTETRVADMPTLDVGGRYILFLRRNGHAFCPLLAATYGSFRVQTDPSTGVEQVLRGNGEPLRTAQDISRPLNRAVVAAASAPAVAMGREQFESSIINQLAHLAPK